jgi:hypothetical protein
VERIVKTGFTDSAGTIDRDDLNRRVLDAKKT